jgi:hypothetical protein
MKPMHYILFNFFFSVLIMRKNYSFLDLNPFCSFGIGMVAVWNRLPFGSAWFF